jgi:hypothetical protein
MSMIAHERPCVTGGAGIGEYLSHTLHKTIFVGIITKDQSSFDAAHNDMVEHSFGIETGMTGHG